MSSDHPKDVELDIVPDRTDSTVHLATGGADRQLTSSSAVSSPSDDKKKADDEKKKEEEKKATELVPLLALFRFSNTTDKIFMIVGLLGAAGTGMGLPLFSVLFGNILSGFNGDLNEILENVKKQCVYFLIVGGAMFILGTIGLSFWLYVSEHLTKRVREQYLKSVLRQHVGWFDIHKPGEVSAQLSSDSSDFNSGTGDKIATTAQHLVTFFGGLIIGLVRGWQLALLILAVTPVMGGLIGSFSVVMSKFNKQSQAAYSEAANIADEALQGVRTVIAFGAQKKEVTRYEGKLGAAKAAGIKAGFTQGGTMAATYFVMFSCYALCLWFGGWLIRQRVHNPWPDADWSGGDVFTVFFALLMASQSMGLVGPCFQAITTARSAAFRLYKVIDTKSEIDVEADVGETISNLQGDIKLQDVDFTYPSRKDAPVFSKFNLDIAPGKTTALVGHSGCGKSTIIGLLERFYDVSGGQVLVDGRNVKDLRLKWWREQIGLVAQEPVLFDGTVKENIAYGRDGLTMAQIEAAAKAANAHEFITKLPGGYDARVGDNGALLSGGQKQRVAIARAIVRNPPILLLDEATSALDNESERLVKEALDNLMSERTSIVIAHRLTTIRKADVICVLSEGKLIEKGNHDQLMARNGAYANLVAAQEAGEALSLDSDDDNDDVKQPPSPVRSVLPNGELEVAVDINTSSLASATVDGSLAPPAMARGRSDSTQKNKPKKTPASINRKRPAKDEDDKKKDEKDKDLKELPKEDVPAVPNSRVWQVAFREATPWVLMAILGAAATGAFMPLWGFIFGDMTAALFETDYDKQERDTRFWALLFVALGVALAIAELVKYGGFGVAGERMTEKLRSDTFKAFLRQEMAFFDEDKHNPRILAGRLSTDASLVHQGTTQKASMTVQVIATMICGLVIAFYYDWALTLVTLSTFPPLTIASQIQMKMFTGFSTAGKKNFEAAEKVASEAIGNIRTVASLTVEQFVLKRFSARLEAPMKDASRSALIAGLAMGFSQFVIFATYALCFWYGAKRVQDGPLSFADMMKCVFCVVMAAVGSGQVMQLAPDFAKAAIARDHIFYYLDRKSKIDTESTEGTRPVLNLGRVTFNDLKFAYPTRPEQNVLNGLNVDIKPGSTVALVGPSGCGKSTLISLLMRMYEPTSGSICIDDNDIVKMNVNTLRSQLAVVSQEPRLFDASIAENIAYGKDGATMEEVIAAAKQANIHDVIMGFPKQYDTTVGTKGGQLSGGQKQRVAIARALIRQPRVLLLDEATSALDTQSERVVQEALENLMRQKDRTIIVIAHRLSTIQNCDVIFVLDKGGIVEQGNHSQLIARNGVYAALARAAEAGAGVST